MGVENEKLENVCTEIWFNELRFSQLDEKGGWAAIGQNGYKTGGSRYIYVCPVQQKAMALVHWNSG